MAKKCITLRVTEEQKTIFQREATKVKRTLHNYLLSKLT